MKRTLVALLVSLVAVPLLAGCLGGDEPPKTSKDDCGDRCDVDNNELTAGLGKITGKIIDDVFTPLEGANVTLRELELTTKTTKDGRYAFNDLEPGTYTVFATNAPTHKADGKQVELAADTVEEVDIILEALPPPAKPYFVEGLEQVGLIGCSVAFKQLQGADQCQKYDSSAKSIFEFQLDARLTTLFIHLDSDAGPAGENQLRLVVDRPAALQSRVHMEGATPLEKRWDFNEDNAWPNWDTVDIIRIDVRANHNASMPQVVYQQRIAVNLAMAYNFYEVPEGYSAAPEG